MVVLGPYAEIKILLGEKRIAEYPNNFGIQFLINMVFHLPVLT